MTPRILLAFCAIVMGCAPRALPSVQSSCPPVQGNAFLPCHVTTPPQPAADRQLPRYPDVFRSAGESGTVRVRYVVDTTGRLRPASLEIVSSSHELFAWTVQRVAPSWRFTPGERDGRRVPVVHEEQFDFALTPGQPRFSIVAWADTTDDGVPRTTLGLPRRDSAATLMLTAAELLEIQRIVLARLSNPSTTPGQTLCVEVREAGESRPADAETLRYLTTGERQAVAQQQCPRTYVRSWIRQPGDPEPPPGWIDPVHLRIEDVDPWTGDHVAIRAVASRGVGSHVGTCVAERIAGAWRVECTVISRAH